MAHPAGRRGRLRVPPPDVRRHRDPGARRGRPPTPRRLPPRPRPQRQRASKRRRPRPLPPRRPARARAVVVRVLGGRPYFADGFERLSRECKARGIPFIALPGEQALDPELTALCHAPLSLVTQVFEYLTQGGVANLVNLLRCLSDNVLLTGLGYEPPTPLPRDGLYHPDAPDGLTLDAWRQRFLQPGRPTVGILFYRAHWMANNVAPIDALIREVEARGGNPFAVFCYSLKDDPDRDDGVPAVFHDFLIDETGTSRVDVIISTLSFTVARLGEETHTEATGPVVDLLERLDVPVIQAVLCTSSRAEWEASSAGLTPRDTAMNVVLPEFDGRIHSVAVSFKEEAGFDERLGTAIKAYVPVDDRVSFSVRLALEPRPAPHRRRTPRSGSPSSSAIIRPRTPGSATASASTRPPRS